MNTPMNDTIKTGAPDTSTVVTIKPNPSTHGKVVKLSVIDQIAPRDYISLCLFFKLPPGVDTREIFRGLHTALQKTVDDIPELACCVQKHHRHDREEVRLLFDSGKGAELHYKNYTSHQPNNAWTCGTFDQLEERHFPLDELPRHAIFGTSEKLVGNERLPSLVVQANFIPGGLILGSCLHHVSGDGMCNYLWHKALGRHLEAITDRAVSESTSPALFLERSSVVEATLDVKLEEFPDWKLAENTTDFLNPTVYRPGEASGFKYAIYFISSEKLALLKRRISLNTPDLKLSTTEILSAFLWPHVVVARDINPQTYPEARLSLAVDARSRIKGPSIPHNYWGNFSEPNAVARLPVARLQNGSPFSSSSPPNSGWTAVYTHAARRIHDAIRAVDDNAVRRLVSLLNQMSKGAMLTWNVDRYPGPDMLIVCIRTHRFNDIHFGHELGYPSATRCTVGDTEGKPDGRCMILPPRRADGQGLEVLLQYDSGTLKRLEGSAEFGNFFVRRN